MNCAKLYELAKQTTDVAVANGFDRPTWDTLPVKIALVMTEIDEAAGVVRADGGDAALAEELADVALRTQARPRPSGRIEAREEQDARSPTRQGD